MTASEIIDNNKLIAEFMGYSKEAQDLGKFPFDKRWDWLMPVVDKIESLGFRVDIYGEFTNISKNGDLLPFDNDISDRLTGCYTEVVSFVKWFRST
jgi:hypothetical protein